MNIQCNKQNLVESVSNVQKSVSSKATLPALEGILIKTKNNSIELTGYDLEMGIKTEIDAIVNNNGSIVVNARLFSDIVRRLPEDDVLISVDDKMIVNIKSGYTDYQIPGISASEFPELPNVNENTKINVDGKLIRDMIKQTIFAVSTNDSKPIHKGSLFELENSELRVISVDGYRLAMKKANIKYQEKTSFVTPSKCLSEISRMIKDDTEEVSIIVGERHIIFKIDNYSIISRLLEGDFLNYRAAIPNGYKTEVIVNTKIFTESVERMSLLLADKSKNALRCVFENNFIKLFCITSLGKANDEFECHQKGDNIEIGFNSRFLLEALKNADTDYIKLQFNGPLSPMKILPADSENFLFLVLPVRLKNEN